MFGSILGLKGYSLQNGDYPEYYKKLKDLKVSIEIESPLEIRKKEQAFNNSVGYASQEQGNNLIIKEQWIENPSYTIRILEESIPEALPLKEYLMESKCIYIPYLGKNDHFADILDVKSYEVEKVEFEVGKSVMIKGLMPDICSITAKTRKGRFYKFVEDLPIAIDRENNHYITEKLIQSNGKMTLKEAETGIEWEICKNEEGVYCFI